MNVAVPGDSARSVPDSARAWVRTFVRKGTRVGHYCSSAVGFLAIVGALALWFQPNWRSAIVERLTPGASADTTDDASAVGLLSTLSAQGASGVPGTSKNGGLAALQGLAAVPGTATPTSAFANVSLGPFGAPLDPNNLPSVVRLARPLQLVPDARFDRLGSISAVGQARVATFIARKYRVAQEPIDVLVHAAFMTGRDVGLDPLLLLAVMAVESGFNPYAESGVGARGLMQVMPVVHSDKFDNYGGPLAALEPVPNLRVGALILKEYIARTGSIEGGLRRYVGATTPGDGGYGAKVLAERDRLRVALKTPLPNAVVASAAKPTSIAANPATPATTASVTVASTKPTSKVVHPGVASVQHASSVASLDAKPATTAGNAGNVAHQDSALRDTSATVAAAGVSNVKASGLSL